MTAKRATPKTANRRRRPWPDDVRERALELLRVDGLAAAHHDTGVSKPTLTRWARAAGIDLGAAAEQTRHATTARGAQLAEATTTRLEQIIELSTRGLVRRLEANADAAELDEADLGEWSAELGTYLPAGEEAAAAVRRYRHLASLEPTRDLVGTLTRAVHDLNLLRGEATERGDVVVNFGIPRPTEPDNVDTVDTGEQ